MASVILISWSFLIASRFKKSKSSKSHDSFWVVIPGNNLDSEKDAGCMTCELILFKDSSILLFCPFEFILWCTRVDIPQAAGWWHDTGTGGEGKNAKSSSMDYIYKNNDYLKP